MYYIYRCIKLYQYQSIHSLISCSFHSFFSPFSCCCCRRWFLLRRLDDGFTDVNDVDSKARFKETTEWNNTFQHFSFESLWNWGPSTSATSIFNAMTVILWYILIYTVIQIRSYCFLADSRRLWLCLFRLGLRTGTSRANNAYIASKNQSYFCSLHVQICARFTYFLQDILQGQCSTIYLKQIWLWLARALWPWVCGFLCRSLGTVTVR